MYKLIRNIHLSLSLIVTPFLFIYAISALFFAHHFLDTSSTENNIEKFTMSSFSKNPSELANLLAKKYGIRGDIKSSSVVGQARVELVISRPGKLYEVVVDTNTGFVTSEEKTQSTLGFIKALHVSADLQSDDFGERLWGLVVMFVAVLLIFILITGLIIWTYRTKERVNGVLFLVANVVYSVSVLCVLRFG